ncbi:hypothetical protein LSTR_LSTR002166 [Laodelphax striatellus]|uniref:RING-type E3 ubiquitin transferase n=1 Tax=Laodelphax striatellus TaxID=195883 RepID=A0A482XRI7_LAOST|nr:hypothetical protein LSTR_LSTR002166 [Laodelphax striatellus]
MTSNGSINTDDGEDYDSTDDPDYTLDEMDVDADSLSFDSVSEIESVLGVIDDIDDPDFAVPGIRYAGVIRYEEVLDSDTDMDSMDEGDNQSVSSVSQGDSNDEVEADEDTEDAGVVEVSDDEATNDAPPTPANASQPRSPAPPLPNTPPRSEGGEKESLPKVSPPSAKKQAGNEEEGMACSICLDTITNSGAHRLVALRCGHVFGHNCVERWLKTGCTHGARRCPDCNKRAKLSDIRVIYAEKLQVLDTSEIERLKSERDKVLAEKNVVVLELTKTKQLCQLQAEKLVNLENQMKQFDQQKPKSCTCSADPYQRNSSRKSFEFLPINSVEINKLGGCRVLAYSCNGILVVSQLSTNPLFAGFGVRKLEGFDLRSTQFIHVHKKQIRDLAFHPTSPNLLLSVSLDKTAKLIDTNNNSNVQSFNDDTMLWSCCWTANNAHQLVTGSQNGVVKLYDTRHQTAPVATWKSAGDSSPVIALAAVHNGALPAGGVISCRFNAVQLIGVHAPETMPQSVLSDGPFTSMSYNSASQMVVTTCRPSQRSRSVRHIVSQMSGSLDPSACLNYIHTFNRGTSARVMSRSHQMLMENGDSCVAAYNETAQSTELLSVNSGGVLSSARFDETVVDLCSIQGSDSSTFLASLTEKNLIVHRLVQGN